MSLIAGDARRVVRVTLRLADGRETDVEIEGAASATAGEIAAGPGPPGRDAGARRPAPPAPRSAASELALRRTGPRDGDVVASIRFRRAPCPR